MTPSIQHKGPETGGVKLSDAQIAMLRFYERNGPTAQSGASGTLNTWRSLIARGLLARSSGLGVVETEITPAGRAALTTPETKP